MTSTEAVVPGTKRGVYPAAMQSTQADDFTQPFWDAALRDELAVPRCTSCETFRLPPYPLCHVCQAEGVEWVTLPGTGTIYTYTVVHHPLGAALADIVPYVSAVVELDGTQGAGARMLANIIDCEPADIQIGTRVGVVFEHVNTEMSVARFRPIH